MLPWGESDAWCVYVTLSSLLLFNTWKPIILIRYPRATRSRLSFRLGHALPRAAFISLLIPPHRWKQVKNCKKKRENFISFLIPVVPDGGRDAAAGCTARRSLALSPSARLSAAMQFGQLLTHLDTTQQMINNTLKDNNTLLAQVGRPASRGRFRRPPAVALEQEAFGEGLGVMTSSQMGAWKFGQLCLVRSVGLEQEVRPRDPSPLHTLSPHRCEASAPISSLFSHVSLFNPHQVQQTMKENLHAIEENFSALDERMKKVSK